MALLNVKDVRINRLTIFGVGDSGESIDVRGIVKEFVIYEDMFASTLSADITISESAALTERLPFTGRNTVEIEFESVPVVPRDRVSTISLRFIAYKISDMVERTDRSQVYVISCVSEEAIKNEETKINRAFRKEYTEVAREVFQSLESDKPLSVGEPNKFSTPILIPNWTPFKTMNLLANRCISNNSGNEACDFFFFEGINKDGAGSTFYFTSIEQFVQNQQGIEQTKRYIKFEVNTIDINKSEDRRAAKNNVESFKVVSTTDHLGDIQGGRLAGTVMTVDLKRKRRDIYTNDIAEDFKGDSAINPFLNIPTNENGTTGVDPDSSVVVVPKHRGMFARDNTQRETGEDSSKTDYTGWRRNAFVGRFGKTKCIIRAPGDSNVRVGDIVIWELPSAQEMTTQKKRHKYLEDRWIVTAITHRVNDDDGYTQTLELIKDSFVENLPIQRGLDSGPLPGNNNNISDFIGQTGFA